MDYLKSFLLKYYNNDVVMSNVVRCNKYENRIIIIYYGLLSWNISTTTKMANNHDLRLTGSE